MKALFLDIDGVLNSARSVFVKIGKTIADQDVLEFSNELNGLPYGVTFGLKCVDPICVALVNRLLQESGAMLVLSSTHRKFFIDEPFTYGSDGHLELLRKYLTLMGIQVPALFSITPIKHAPRGYEVEAWLNNAYENGVIDDGDPYVILDDGRDFDPDQSLVWCDPDIGFSFAEYAVACKALGTQPPGLILL
jgi:HAD domain in Swiss Army Knife RNA repair proteins